MCGALHWSSGCHGPNGWCGIAGGWICPHLPFGFWHPDPRICHPAPRTCCCPGGAHRCSPGWDEGLDAFLEPASAPELLQVGLEPPPQVPVGMLGVDLFTTTNPMLPEGCPTLIGAVVVYKFPPPGGTFIHHHCSNCCWAAPWEHMGRWWCINPRPARHSTQPAGPPPGKPHATHHQRCSPRRGRVSEALALR
jgi:hypothetical protein